MSNPITVEQVINKFPSRFNPEKAVDFEAVFQFELEDDSDFYLTIADQQCRAIKGEHDDPNITLIMDAATMIDVINGELDGMSAFMQGRLRAEGNLLLAPKLGELFSHDKQTG